MGLRTNEIRFLLYARTKGVKFRRVATIGRQSVFAPADELSDVLRRYGHDSSLDFAAHLLQQRGGFAEPLLEMIGAQEIRSFDASAFEDATDVHDFNYPLPEKYHGNFDVVIDSGTLEHVFNVPVALQNIMQLTSMGGHVLAMNPANNWFGHGFYQFSPEFFYRAYSRESGFELMELLLFEDVADCMWGSVPDPATLNRRVHFESSRRTSLAMLAKRVAAVAPLTRAPQESDYAEIWSDASVDVFRRTSDARGEASPASAEGLRTAVRRTTPTALRDLVRARRRAHDRRRLQRYGFERANIP